jgi:NitT/TauT family transport system permease protein
MKASAARNGVLRLLLLIGSLLLWEAIVRGFAIPLYVLPPPSGILVALYRGLASQVYLDHLWVTLSETLFGFLFGCAIAFVLGTPVALSRRFEYFLYPYIVMLQALPKVALAPLLLIWLGLGLSSKVAQAALTAFFPLMVNTIAGLRSADEDRINLMRSLAASPAQIFWMLRLPSALPFIMAGLEVSLSLALIGAIVAEFVGAQAGLGMLMQSMNYTMDVGGQFSILLILAVLGLALNSIILLVRRRLLFWDASQKSASTAGDKGGAGR